MMNCTKKVSAFVGAIVLVTMFFVGVPLHTMISQKSVRLRTQPVQQVQPERYKNKLISVRTFDNVHMKLPQWQIDQMKAVQHKGEGTESHWVNAPMITSDELELVQKALNKSNKLEKFKDFYTKLSEDQKGILINSAAKLEMQGLTSLLMAYTFPIDVQKQIGATIDRVDNSIITPVVEYLKKNQKENQEKILKGHKDTVRCVAYSPDGSHIVSGSRETENNLILWDSKTGKKIKILKGHKDTVRCVAYSPDGSYIVSGSMETENNLILWDSKTGEKIKVLKGHKYGVYCVAYSPDGNYIVSGSYVDDNLILWDSKTGEKIKSLNEYNNFVDYVAYSPDGNDIVFSLADNLILWDSKTDKKIKILKGHNDDVRCVAYSPDGNFIVSGSKDNNLILWNGKTGEKIKVLKGHAMAVFCVAYSPDSNFIVSGTEEGDLILWDGKTGEKIKTFGDRFKGAVCCVAYSPDSNTIVSGSGKNLILWKLIDQKTIDYIATQLNIAQARFLHRLYMAQKNNMPVVLDTQDADYRIYLTLPDDVQHAIKLFLPFELASDFVEKQIQAKMNEYRLKFKKMAATTADKIKTLKILMKDLEKDSIDYKACVRLLQELELEEAFEV
jgi:WD40 repeat protein